MKREEILYDIAIIDEINIHWLIEIIFHQEEQYRDIWARCQSNSIARANEIWFFGRGGTLVQGEIPTDIIIDREQLSQG